jgi:hypothetical protein
VNSTEWRKYVIRGHEDVEVQREKSTLPTKHDSM